MENSKGVLMDKKTRYYINDVEVTKTQFIQEERNAGFRPKQGDGIATGGFFNGKVSGTIRTE